MSTIQRINKIKDFGIYTNFNGNINGLAEFKRFNLIYGWNGSGKSTLSKLFALLEYKTFKESFPYTGCEFEFTSNQNTINHGSFPTNNLNIRVFNQDFINENIQWDRNTKSILVVSEGKIEEKKKLDELKIEINKQKSLLGLLNIDNDTKINTKSVFLSSTAKIIKEAFKIIDTSDTHYFNYNKSKLDNFINISSGNLNLSESILNESELETLTNSIKPTLKNELKFELVEIENQKLLSAEGKVKALLETSVVNESIQRLKDNSDIQDWVRHGKQLHAMHESDSCEYCGQVIPKNRIQELEKHFNDEYTLFITKIESAINWADTQIIIPIELPDATTYYDEFQPEYIEYKKQYSKFISTINAIIKAWYHKLIQKKSKPFEIIINDLESINTSIDALNVIVKQINNLKSKHNLKTENFQEILKTQKTKLETHYAAEAIKENGFLKLESDLIKLKADIKTKNDHIIQITKDAFDIEKTLTDEVKGAADFNDLLHSFLGRNDISLVFEEQEKGYKIVRKGNVNRAKNLSEGEKTAIAFIYFIIKLKENGNKMEDTIVVVDDPVSSLDSNHLIHAYAFLKNQCINVKQLFVLTHNFHFFKLIRDWFYYVKQNEGDKAYYTISSALVNNERQSILINANDFLLKYNSEYHFLFSKIYEFSEKEISSDEMYIIANLSRRFIESLITFKYPKKTKDIWEKFKNVSFDETKKTKVYKFINLFSHNDKIESHESFGDNIFSEGKALVKDTLEFIEAIDKDHYDELVEICK